MIRVGKFMLNGSIEVGLTAQKESALHIWMLSQLVAGWAHSLSTVLAQDHFYSDFLSLLLTKQIHFESAKMMALAQHSLSVMTFVRLMIERAVHLLSRFVFC